MPESAFPDHIGIGANEVPCKVVSFDFARDDAPPVVAQQDPDGTMRIVEWDTSPAPGPTITVEQARFTAERTGWYDFPGLRPSSHYLVDTSAPPNSCSRCGADERGHGDNHEYVAPDDVLRLARMKARRQARLNPPRRIRLVDGTIAHLTVDLSGFRAAIECLNEALRPAVDQMRALADTLAQDDADDEDYGGPLTDADANWPDDASRVCAHICGGDHECDVRATMRLTYELPSGGTRSMPICASCNAAETAAKEAANA